jgi:FlaA1/EpsC-like NDP-sugar epimerase
MNVDRILSNRIGNIKTNPFIEDIKDQAEFLRSQIEGKKVIVIGGAGTIGCNYLKQILKYKPSKVTVVDFNENGLTELTRDLRSSRLLDYNPEYITYPVNLLSSTFDKIFNSDTWDIVSNFSAHKHVRSEKDLISIEALINNNVFGAIKLLELCSQKPPKYFFSVSTDKAANPVNIMGASKSLMERLILSRKNSFRVSTARFANVAFSNGSLLDGFLYRFSKQQPLSCPSDIKRFFVSPEQSGQICLLATFLGNSGFTFFPNLDFLKDQVYFKDLAIDILESMGLEPAIVKSENEAKLFNFETNPKKYPIFFFKTDTSGEKPYEEFYSVEDYYDVTQFHSLGFIKPKEDEDLISFIKVKTDFENIFNNSNSSKKDVISTLKNYVPDFNHIETNKHLDQKM